MSDLLQDIPERRPNAGDPWQALAAAVAELAVRDLISPRRVLREDAAAFVRGPGFAAYLDMAGIRNSVDEVRRALRRSGRLRLG
jgi:hypothetical protein